MSYVFTYETETLEGAYRHYEIDVEVTHFLNVEGDHKTWDSADDYNGYLEIEWDFLGWSATDEDGGEVGCDIGEPPIDCPKLEDWLIEQMIEASKDEY